MSMTEKEKLRRGLLHNSMNDPELLGEFQYAKDMCYEYNNLHPRKKDDRKAVLKLLLGGIKGDALIEPPFFCDYGYNIKVGHKFYANHGCVMLDPAEITFGDNVFLGPNCGFYTAEHPLDAMQRRDDLELARPIKVGNDVWFGGNVVVLAGVTIGDNVVIGAGSVVTKDIPSNCIAYGNPCRVRRTIPAI